MSPFVTTSLLLIGSVANFNVDAFVVPSTSRSFATNNNDNNIVKRQIMNPLFMDPQSSVDFVDTLTNAWSSYNVALEEDPLVTK